MTWRRVTWVVVVLAAAAAAAFVIPGSPFYLPEYLTRGSYEGRPTAEWRRALARPEPEVRAEACHALGAIGPDATDAVPALAGLMVGDPDRMVRTEAAHALSKMNPASRAAVPELARALSDPEPIVRVHAAMALSRLRTDARPAVPALIAALSAPGNDTYSSRFTFTTRELIALALGRASADTADGVPALTAALETATTDPFRRTAARALGEVGRPAAPALPQLRSLLTSPDPDVREAADWAIGRIES